MLLKWKCLFVRTGWCYWITMESFTRTGWSVQGLHRACTFPSRVRIHVSMHFPVAFRSYVGSVYRSLHCWSVWLYGSCIDVTSYTHACTNGGFVFFSQVSGSLDIAIISGYQVCFTYSGQHHRFVSQALSCGRKGGWNAQLCWARANYGGLTRLDVSLSQAIWLYLLDVLFMTALRWSTLILNWIRIIVVHFQTGWLGKLMSNFGSRTILLTCFVGFEVTRYSWVACTLL